MANTRDELIQSVYDGIQKSDSSAYFLDEQDWNPSDITDWVSTGDPILDIKISNRPNGGIPVGRITEIFGLESTGKSLLAAHLLAETQKQGGIPVFIDTEHAQMKDFLGAIGLDLSNLIYVSEYLIENIFIIIENIIEKVRKSESDRLVTIVVDSVMGATNKVEDEATYDIQGYATQKAILLSQAMRKITPLIARQRIALIFTNQVREKVGVLSFGDKYKTSGGKAIPFHSSVRLKVARISKIKESAKAGADIIGIKSKVTIEKNRVGPPFRHSEVELYFDRGMDPTASWYKACKDAKIIKVAGAGYFTYGVDKYQGINGFHEILKDKTVKEEIYKKICDFYIKPYANQIEKKPIDPDSIVEDLSDD